MKTRKTMSIIGMVLGGLSLICLVAFNNQFDYESGIGWGMYSALYLIAFSIVVKVKNRK
jgi:uncharacterized membrane protein (UPF0136 family)